MTHCFLAMKDISDSDGGGDLSQQGKVDKWSSYFIQR